MNLLLDTQIFIWWNGNMNMLSPEVQALCQDRANTLLLSLVSVWEMQIKSQLGKLRFDQPLPKIIESQRQGNGIELLPIHIRHVYALQHLPAYHKDPFDRLLIAQANVENVVLVSADPAFRQYQVRLLS